MQPPFTVDQFFDVFRRYNTAVWPAQWVVAALGVVAVLLALRNRPSGNRWVSAILALLWFWTAFAYHVSFFASVNRVAVAFAAAFALQGVMFGQLTFRAHSPSYRPRSTITATIGALLITYALVGYPVLGYLIGHRYPEAPTFGVPCPTTIFTLGLVVWTCGSMRWHLLIIPLGWTVVGMSAAVNLGMSEDFGLLVAAIVSAGSFVTTRRRAPGTPVTRIVVPTAM